MKSSYKPRGPKYNVLESNFEDFHRQMLWDLYKVSLMVHLTTQRLYENQKARRHKYPLGTLFHKQQSHNYLKKKTASLNNRSNE